MSNALSFPQQVNIIASLTEGASIRGIERMTGCHRDTIMALGKRVGDACAAFMDAKMKNLNCERIEADELWGFIGKKQKHCLPEDFARGFGDAYTYVALDAETKLVPSFLVGRRDYQNTNLFLGDLSLRLKKRIQLTTDGLIHYHPAIESIWGVGIDYGQIVKTFETGDLPDQRRYSPPAVVKVSRAALIGEPDDATISTSYVENQNHTVRMHCRRLSRLTNAFSKKLENLVVS